MTDPFADVTTVIVEAVATHPPGTELDDDGNPIPPPED